MSCDVCHGTPRLYPIIDKFGSQLYEIQCPECGGSGLSEAEEATERQRGVDLSRYLAAMAEMRGPGGGEAVQRGALSNNGLNQKDGSE